MQAPEAIRQWHARPEYLRDLARDAIDSLPAAVEAAYDGVLRHSADAAGCVRWALSRFRKWFDSSVAALCRQFPADHLTESGEPFWSGGSGCSSSIRMMGSSSTVVVGSWMVISGA